ncbi:MAG: GerAB/ArcD/ProY family transporter [Oscillospiraceae bacterium]|nr:GerAB/ArcD/ProY family transporter [Oscillospiraceae bacterium]
MKKINARQAYLLFVLASLSPSLRFTGKLCAAYGGSAGWVGILLSCGAFYGLARLLAVLCAGGGLYDRCRRIVGKPAGTAAGVVYMLWLLLLAAFTLRDFAGKLAVSFLPGPPAAFFMVTLLAVCFLILKGNREHFARMAAIGCWAAVLAVAAAVLLTLPEMKIEHLWPVTHYQAGPILRSIVPMLGVYAYLTFLLLSGGEAEKSEELKKYAPAATAAMGLINIAVFAATAGVFGPELTQQLPAPFYMAVKSIRIFKTVQRLESLFLIFWILADLALLVLLLHTVLALLRRTVRTERTEMYAAPVLAGVYGLALLIAGNIAETEEFARQIVIPVNIALGFGAPVLLGIVGRGRREMKN